MKNRLWQQGWRLGYIIEAPVVVIVEGQVCMTVMMCLMMFLVEIMGHEEAEDIFFMIILRMGIKMGDQIAQLQYRIGDALRQGECQQIKEEVSDEPFFHGEGQR
jgi:hypothetical protein